MATRIWNGSISSDWTDAANWENGEVPIDGDDIELTINAQLNLLDLTTDLSQTFGYFNCGAYPNTILNANFSGSVYMGNSGAINGGAFGGLVTVYSVALNGGTFNGGITGDINVPAPTGGTADLQPILNAISGQPALVAAAILQNPAYPLANSPRGGILAESALVRL